MSILKNILNVEITRPDQVLIIMRGLAGSGKSTKAKELVGNGIIHSTDSVIERQGDYFEFFKQIEETKNAQPLFDAHVTNLREACASMKAGITPVIIDNMNIKLNSPKNYVLAALNLGFDEKNIKIVDIGTNGLTAEELFERGTHKVKLEELISLIASYKAQGEMTVEKILAAKDMVKMSNVLYSCVSLDRESHIKLMSNVEYPLGWISHASHMTIGFNEELEDKNEIGKVVSLTVTHVGKSDKNVAVRVTGYPSKNEIPHVTIAVTPKGGKAKDSNLITEWVEITPFQLTGVVTEVTKT